MPLEDLPETIDDARGLIIARAAIGDLEPLERAIELYRHAVQIDALRRVHGRLGRDVADLMMARLTSRPMPTIEQMLELVTAQVFASLQAEIDALAIQGGV